MIIIAIPISSAELVAKGDELLAYQSNEPVNGSVIGVHQNLSKGTKLTSTVPSISAMHQHTASICVHIGCYSTCCYEDGGDMLEPVSGSDVTPLGLSIPGPAHFPKFLK